MKNAIKLFLLMSWMVWSIRAQIVPPSTLSISSVAAATSGTVTSVSVATANGISGSVATANTTPTITLALGAISPLSVNGLTVTTTTGTFSLASGKTFVIDKSIEFDGTDGTKITFPSTNATVARSDAANTFSGNQTFNAAPIANTGIYTTTVSGTGAVSYGSAAPVTYYAKSVTVLTAATPADIATITLPAGLTRWHTVGAASAATTISFIVAETASGTLAGATFVAFDAAGGAGTQLLGNASGPGSTAATAGVPWSPASLGNSSTSQTIYIRQTANSANSGTVSFYITVFPIL